MRIVDPEKLAAVGAIGTASGSIGYYLSIANVAVSLLATLCSLIISAYGLYCIYEKRKAKRAAARRADCPDKAK